MSKIWKQKTELVLTHVADVIIECCVCSNQLFAHIEQDDSFLGQLRGIKKSCSKHQTSRDDGMLRHARTRAQLLTKKCWTSLQFYPGLRAAPRPWACSRAWSCWRRGTDWAARRAAPSAPTGRAAASRDPAPTPVSRRHSTQRAWIINIAMISVVASSWITLNIKENFSYISNNHESEEQT